MQPYKRTRVESYTTTLDCCYHCDLLSCIGHVTIHETVEYVADRVIRRPAWLCQDPCTRERTQFYHIYYDFNATKCYHWRLL